jgi:hypothetical protein
LPAAGSGSRTTIKIESTNGAGEGSEAQHKKVYLWTAFFKIDGDMVSVNEALNLEGTATVVGTPGNHGDLGDTGGDTANNVTVTIPIPTQIGQFRSVLKPIPLKRPIGNISSAPGAIGCVVLLLAEGAVPNQAIAKGHDAFNSGLQDQLNQIVATLGLSKQEPSQDDVDSMTKAISDQVEKTIKDNLSFWEKLGALFLGADEMIGHSLFRFSATDLAKAPATGLPLHDLLVTGGAGAASDPSGNPVAEVSVTQSYELNGVIFCDPLDASLRRFLDSQRLNGTQGIRGFMRPRFLSVKDWMASVPW